MIADSWAMGMFASSSSECLSTTGRVNGGGGEDETLSRCKDLIFSSIVWPADYNICEEFDHQLRHRAGQGKNMLNYIFMLKL